MPSGWEGRRGLGIEGKAGSVRRKTLGRKVRGGKDAVGRREGGSLECCRGDGAGGKAERVGEGWVRKKGGWGGGEGVNRKVR